MSTKRDDYVTGRAMELLALMCHDDVSTQLTVLDQARRMLLALQEDRRRRQERER
jgi:hypothetical protein